MCWIHNCLLSFNLFISISSPKLICFSSRAIDNGVHSYPGNFFFLSMVINTSTLLYLACCMQIEVRVLKLIRKGMGGLEHGEDSMELKLITVALSRIVPGSFLISLWQEVLRTSCAKSGANAAFLLLFGFLPPQDGSQHSDYLCIFKHGTIYFLKSLMYS